MEYYFKKMRGRPRPPCFAITKCYGMSIKKIAVRRYGSSIIANVLNPPDIVLPVFQGDVPAGSQAGRLFRRTMDTKVSKHVGPHAESTAASRIRTLKRYNSSMSYGTGRT